MGEGIEAVYEPVRGSTAQLDRNCERFVSGDYSCGENRRTMTEEIDMLGY